MIEAITSKKEWNLLIDAADFHDFYSTYDYHILSNINDEKPILIKFTQGDTIIGLPLILRKIKNTPYFDATSVYGYAGPIAKNVEKNFDNQLFKSELNNFFIDNHIVSVFSRLNPYLPNQDIILRNMGEIKMKGDIVMIDLNQALDVQRQQYQKRIKSHINNARKHCTTRKAQTKADIDTFINLYHESMTRVDAEKSYFFSDDYFYNLLNNDQCKIEIFLASLLETSEIISAAMFIKSKDIIHYHLSGAKTEYLHIAALKLLIDEMRIEGTKERYKALNLGGGLQSKDDSLLRFKKSFSKTIKQFSVWEHVVNEEVYQELVVSSKTSLDEQDYFPKYRSPH